MKAVFAEENYVPPTIQVAQRATIAHLCPMCQGQISFQKFELIQALMLVLVTWKYQKDPIKNNREKVETPFSPL